MDVAALIVSFLALLFSAASVVYTRRQTARRVRVKALWGRMTDDGANVLVSTDRGTQDAVAEGFTRPCRGVEVQNIGALPVTVEQWSVAIDEVIVTPGLGGDWCQGPELPHQLPAGASARWIMPEEKVQVIRTALASQKRAGGANGVRMKVSFGDGSEATTERMADR